ncbi:MAG: 2-hydroxyacid dehydrogenase [Chlamydiales bacterium]|nr:2-hydroxyacid dehydrogenase [Chlamydiales bacterium]
MLKVAIYDTKPYDREFISKAAELNDISLNFYEFHLNKKTVESAKGHDAVCAFVNDRIDAECLEKLSRFGLKLIALRCAGYNNVDIEAAHRFNIAVTRVPAYSPHSVAEHAVGLLISLSRKIHRAYNRAREMNFSLHGLVGFEINGKTVGVVGTGKIGKIFAQIMQGFDTEVLAYDFSPSIEWAAQFQISYVEGLEILLRKSDIISLHVPLLPSTYHLINKETIKEMKRGVILINTSRGKVIETHALISGLKSGKVGGVALDTYEEEEDVFFEDLSDRILLDDELSRLLSFPNVLVTSHQGFLTKEALYEIAKSTIENFVRLSKGMSFIAGTQL